MIDAPLSHAAELAVAPIREECLVLGTFQRAPADGDPRPRVRRVSGGAIVEAGPGTLHVVLALSHPAALVPCDAPRLVNRYVRPLLSAMTKLGRKANYFGRDWISMAKCPVAWVGFAHDSESGRSAFEALVAVSTPFATGARKERPSFNGREPATLEEALGRAVSADALSELIVRAYSEAFAGVGLALGAWAPELVPAGADPPWAATAREAVGEIGAGPDARGIFRIGGDFLASRDAVARLERDVAELRSSGRGADTVAVQERVQAVFMAPDVAFEGVRSPTSLTDVIVRANALG